MRRGVDNAVGHGDVVESERSRATDTAGPPPRRARSIYGIRAAIRHRASTRPAAHVLRDVAALPCPSH
ncbi:hypothetical protein BMAPRL20_1791 [Burkholderia mallei PRL-20]|nr:hypothetical protein BMAPRL20_1791 [Burkholderia mallei PRL-20]